MVSGCERNSLEAGQLPFKGIGVQLETVKTWRNNDPHG